MLPDKIAADCQFLPEPRSLVTDRDTSPVWPCYIFYRHCYFLFYLFPVHGVNGKGLEGFVGLTKSYDNAALQQRTLTSFSAYNKRAISDFNTGPRLNAED